MGRALGSHALDVGEAAEFPERSARIVLVDGQEIGVFKVDGDVYAYRNVCPHQGGPVCRGRVQFHLVAHTSHAFEIDPRRLILACPWHGWEFDLRTGGAVWSEKYRLKTWPVRIEEGRVMVGLG